MRDSAGVLRLGRLYFVSPGQINFEVPAVTAYAGSGLVSAATVTIKNATPGIFTANGNGAGVPAALALRVAPNGAQSPVIVFQCNAAGCSPAPIVMGGDQVFIELYGTGARKRTSLENVTCTIGGVAAPVAFAGAQRVIGLDQINVQIPDSLRGRGEVQLLLTVDGETANPVTLNVQ